MHLYCACLEEPRIVSLRCSCAPTLYVLAPCSRICSIATFTRRPIARGPRSCDVDRGCPLRIELLLQQEVRGAARPLRRDERGGALIDVTG